jgi:hypothetical protein
MVKIFHTFIPFNTNAGQNPDSLSKTAAPQRFWSAAMTAVSGAAFRLGQMPAPEPAHAPIGRRRWLS